MMDRERRRSIITRRREEINQLDRIVGSEPGLGSARQKAKERLLVCT
jgi:hypothetical protein